MSRPSPSATAAIASSQLVLPTSFNMHLQQFLLERRNPDQIPFDPAFFASTRTEEKKGFLLDSPPISEEEGARRLPRREEVQMRGVEAKRKKKSKEERGAPVESQAGLEEEDRVKA